MSGTWTALTKQPSFAASTMLLLTDGSVMCQESGGVNWWKLTPDASGSYVNGTWSALAPMKNTRLYYGSAVFADGQVIVTGGEYSDAGSETNTCERYDPVLDTWTTVKPPSGWKNIGDGVCTLLPDGRYITGNPYDKRTAVYDPVAGAWSNGPTMLGRSDEESWVLMPDETVVAPQCDNHPNAEKLVLAAGAWMTAGALPVDLVEDASSEIGPGTLLPDGRAFFVGATGRTALYNAPTIANQPGTWTIGPTLPTDAQGRQLGAKDAPSCLLPNGNVLCAVGPVDGLSSSYLSPTSFFEFDGVNLVRVADPSNATGVPYEGRMMLTPTGQVLFAAANAISVYTPSGGPDNAWRPTITACPTLLREGGSYTLHGRQLNGLSQAVGYGDDAMAATNYPLVRVHHLASGTTYYCRTSDHSTMAVATGTAVHFTNFDVPLSAPLGPSQLVVVANGIESAPIAVDVLPFRLRWPFDDALFNRLLGSLADGPLWVLGPHGPVPVGPWGPRYEKQATSARSQLVGALRKLRDLGTKVVADRTKVAAATPPSVDEEAEAARSGEARTSTSAGTRTTRARKDTRGRENTRTRRLKTSSSATRTR